MGSLPASGLLRLPQDLLITLPEVLHDIEDYMNLSSTCRTLRRALAATLPNTILRLVHSKSRVFFRPDPHFLVAATARELGHWARQSDANEHELADGLKRRGIGHLMDLALDHCGLTMERIRELHAMRYSLINPTTDIIDQCVGRQWYALPDFWNTVDDAYTIDAEPPETLFHLVTYGELFGPEFDAFLGPESDGGNQRRILKVETRLEFVKYCMPGFETTCYLSTADPRRTVVELPGGPYLPEGPRGPYLVRENHNIALKWVLKSVRWRPHWNQARADAQAGSAFVEDDVVEDGEAIYYDLNDGAPIAWRQVMWEQVMVCQGLEGLGMLRQGTEDARRWQPKIREWKDAIAALSQEPERVRVGDRDTHVYPDLFGDLYTLSSGYAGI